MSKELVKSNGQVPAYLQVAGSWGAENTSASDIILPRINLTQQMSDAVINEKAKAGQFIGNIDGNILGGKDKPLEFIPFYVTRTLVKYQIVEGKQKFISTEDLNAINEKIPFEEIDMAGNKYKNVKNFNVYVILPEELKTGQYIPYLLTFRNMSYNAGKKLSTMFEKLKAFNVPIAAKTFILSASLKENDKGKFYVYDVSQKDGYNSEEQVNSAYGWYEKVKQGKTKLSEDQEVASEPSTTDGQY